jgi:hypothetical protein
MATLVAGFATTNGGSIASMATARPAAKLPTYHEQAGLCMPFDEKTIPCIICGSPGSGQGNLLTFDEVSNHVRGHKNRWQTV